MSRGQCQVLISTFLVISGVVFLRSGLPSVILLLLGAGVGLHLFLRWRYVKRVNQMVSQLPMFLDHMIRSLKSGRNVSDAMLLAVQRSESPLKEALLSCTRAMSLGLTMSEVVKDFATLYDRKEFYILATTIKVNQQYGGNASQLMESLIVMIRDHDRAQAQLRALTGESRMSAWILGGMPVLMGGYIFFANPDFFMGLWNHETGRSLLYTAICFQFGGVFLLWRMMRSI
ncbi:MAG: type II secretion system F family protein [Gammaproteobacteria bacterium]